MKEYTFSYRFDGKSWSVGIFADSPEEAKAKFRALAANGQYDGEVVAKVYVPCGGVRRLWGRLLSWFGVNK